MPRDVDTRIIVTQTNFLITGSQDASSYQSTKTADEKDRQNTSAIAASIEFVKHFRGHLDDIDNLSSEILFKSKLNTDLIELVKRKLIPLILEFNVSDEQFALIEKSLTQRKLFLFDTLKGKIF
ncbi:unnamed protein product [Rotaria sp. Silwood1]|nr:unnamed protein product [Rotaria sp. Silwood1]